MEVVDGLRGLAILLVLFFHETLISPNGLLLSRWLKLARIGWTGVDLFFVLSGFLITGILVDARERPDYYKNFLGRRALRILPAYLVFFSLCYVFFPIFVPLSAIEVPPFTSRMWMDFFSSPT